MGDKRADLTGPGIGDYAELERVLPTDYRSLLTPHCAADQLPDGGSEWGEGWSFGVAHPAVRWCFSASSRSSQSLASAARNCCASWTGADRRR
jgi:hypothetical protein